MTVHVGRAEDWQPDESCYFDAIYFDPFAPAHNDELWNSVFLNLMYRRLRPGGTLVTYCVNRVVKETLADVGFDVQVVRGPRGGKRNVLVANKSDH